MTELSEIERFYINVGKCLSLWNEVEVEVLRIIEYAAASSRMPNSSLKMGYWAIRSFEARLKMCNAMVSARLHEGKYEKLSKRWNTLNNKLIKKAQKRAEVAHGSVVTFRSGKSDQSKCVRFIPAFNKKLDEFTVPQIDGKFDQWDQNSFHHITIHDMGVRAKSFRQLRMELNRFMIDWMTLDADSADA